VTNAKSGPVPARIAEPGWWRQPFRMMQTNLRLIDAGLDVDAVAETVRAHGADAWLLNTGGIYASFPSELASQTPNPELGRRPSGDIVGDAVRAARARGLRLLARMDFSKVLPHVAADHPEWLYVSASGERQVFNGLVTTCPSAGYFQQEAFDILSEVLRRFDVDGFFINWFMYSEWTYSHEYLGPCHCQTCRAEWRAEHGGEPPTGPQDAGYATWQEWSRAKVLELGGRLRAHIESISPDTPLILHDTADIRYAEANNAVGREFWPHQTDESVSAAFTRQPQTPVLVNCVSFLDFPYRMAVESPDRFANYLVQAMARGGAISTYIMGPPGAIDYGPVLEVAGDITRFHQRHDDLYAHLEQTAEAVIIDPVAADVHGPGAAATAEFRGLYSALRELHVPFDVLEAGELSRVPTAQLDRYSTMVLPDAARVPSVAATAVDEWVSRGGRLIATLAEVGTGGMPRALGIEAIERSDIGASLLSAYAMDREGGVVPLHGVAHHVRPVDGAASASRLVPPARYGPPEYCYGHEASDEPSLVEYIHGEGRSATFTWSMGRAYRELDLPSLRHHFALALRDLAPEIFLATDLPESIGVIAGRSGDRQVLHLVNHTGLHRNGFGTPVVASGYSVDLPAGAHSIHALVADQVLTSTLSDGKVRVALPPISTFEVLTWKDAE